MANRKACVRLVGGLTILMPRRPPACDNICTTLESNSSSSSTIQSVFLPITVVTALLRAEKLGVISISLTYAAVSSLAIRTCKKVWSAIRPIRKASESHVGSDVGGGGGTLYALSRHINRKSSSSRVNLISGPSGREIFL
jgi:hypothetical protein